MTRTVYSGAAVFDGTRMHHDAVLVVEGSEIAGILPEAAAPEGPRVALSGGVLPVSAVLARDEIMLTIKPGQHGYFPAFLFFFSFLSLFFFFSF